jgi:hypothetical protein
MASLMLQSPKGLPKYDLKTTPAFGPVESRPVPLMLQSPKGLPKYDLKKKQPPTWSHDPGPVPNAQKKACQNMI